MNENWDGSMTSRSKPRKCATRVRLLKTSQLDNANSDTRSKAAKTVSNKLDTYHSKSGLYFGQDDGDVERDEDEDEDETDDKALETTWSEISRDCFKWQRLCAVMASLVIIGVIIYSMVLATQLMACAGRACDPPPLLFQPTHDTNQTDEQAISSELLEQQQQQQQQQQKLQQEQQQQQHRQTVHSGELEPWRRPGSYQSMGPLDKLPDHESIHKAGRHKKNLPMTSAALTAHIEQLQLSYKQKQQQRQAEKRVQQEQRAKAEQLRLWQVQQMQEQKEHRLHPGDHEQAVQQPAQIQVVQVQTQPMQQQFQQQQQAVAGPGPLLTQQLQQQPVQAQEQAQVQAQQQQSPRGNPLEPAANVGIVSTLPVQGSGEQQADSRLMNPNQNFDAAAAAAAGGRGNGYIPASWAQQQHQQQLEGGAGGLGVHAGVGMDPATAAVNAAAAASAAAAVAAGCHQQQASMSPACEHLLAAARATAAASASHMAATAVTNAADANAASYPIRTAAATVTHSAARGSTAGADAGSGAGAAGASAGWHSFPTSFVSKPLVSIGLSHSQSESVSVSGAAGDSGGVSASPAQAAAEASLRAAVGGADSEAALAAAGASSSQQQPDRPLSCTNAESVQRMAESSGRPFLLLSPSPHSSPSLRQQQQELMQALWVARVTQSTLVLPARWRERRGVEEEETPSGDDSAWGLSRVYDMPLFIAQMYCSAGVSIVEDLPDSLATQLPEGALAAAAAAASSSSSNLPGTESVDSLAFTPSPSHSPILIVPPALVPASASLSSPQLLTWLESMHLEVGSGKARFLLFNASHSSHPASAEQLTIRHAGMAALHPSSPLSAAISQALSGLRRAFVAHFSPTMSFRFAALHLPGQEGMLLGGSASADNGSGSAYGMVSLTGEEGSEVLGRKGRSTEGRVSGSDSNSSAGSDAESEADARSPQTTAIAAVARALHVHVNESTTLLFVSSSNLQSRVVWVHDLRHHYRALTIDDLIANFRQSYPDEQVAAVIEAGVAESAAVFLGSYRTDLSRNVVQRRCFVDAQPTRVRELGTFRRSEHRVSVFYDLTMKLSPCNVKF